MNKYIVMLIALVIGVFVTLSMAIQDLRDELQVTGNSLKEVKQENTQLNKTLTQTKLDLESAKGEIKKLNTRLQQTQDRATELEQQNQELNTKLNQKHDEVNKLNERIDTLRRQAKSVSTITNHPKQVTGVSKPSVQVSRDSKVNGKTIYMKATAYTAYCTGCSGTTRTGINLRANPNAKVIAVDPSVIPLGSKVYVEGYGYAIAADTGGAIKGHKIDIFMPSKERAYQWGVRTVAVKVLPKG